MSAPTAQDDLGLPHDRLLPHAVLVATGNFSPITLDANLGYGRAPDDPSERGDLYHFSAAVTVQSTRHLSLLLDTSVDTNPDRTGKTFAAVTQLGVIYTVHPRLDIDAGFRGRINGAGPAQQWLVGITFRWGS